MTGTLEQPDYGIDAPAVIRNLLIAGFAMLVVAVLARFGVLPAVLSIHPSGNVAIRFPLFATGLGSGFGFTAVACWMYLGSRYGKTKERDRLLDRIVWNGDEQVLDVGCGRGLVLVGAAARLTSGRAVVVVVSRAAIHNLYSAPERARAIAEIARVLKPGGRALINDIRHLQEYAANFVAAGCRDVRLLDSRWTSALCALVTMGSLRPNTILVNKAAPIREEERRA